MPPRHNAIGPSRPQAVSTLAAATAATTPVLTPAQSTLGTPIASTITSANPSAYPSEDEDDELGAGNLNSIRRLTIRDLTPSTPVRFLPHQPDKPFRFLDLPVEIRLRIYDHHFIREKQHPEDEDDGIIDLESDNWKRLHPKLAIFRTCRTIAREASDHFYSTHTIRIFSISSGRFFRTKRHLLQRFKPRIRPLLRCLELRLGPGFSKAPDGWVVKERMGLKKCVNVRLLKVYVQVDPASSHIADYCRPMYYENFSRDLLKKVLAELPSVEKVEFDGWANVTKSSKMMKGLFEEVTAAGKVICWGPDRGWTDDDDADDSGVEMDMPGDIPIVLSENTHAHAPAVLVAA